MGDTSPRMRAQFAELIARRAPEERIKMATGMFEGARLLLRAGLAHLDGVKLEQELFLRMYGGDISPRMRDDVLSIIETRFADRNN